MVTILRSTGTSYRAFLIIYTPLILRLQMIQRLSVPFHFRNGLIKINRELEVREYSQLGILLMQKPI